MVGVLAITPACPKRCYAQRGVRMNHTTRWGHTVAYPDVRLALGANDELFQAPGKAKGGKAKGIAGGSHERPKRKPQDK